MVLRVAQLVLECVKSVPIKPFELYEEKNEITETTGTTEITL